MSLCFLATNSDCRRGATKGIMRVHHRANASGLCGREASTSDPAARELGFETPRCYLPQRATARAVSFFGPERTMRPTPGAPRLPPALLHRLIVLAGARTRIA